LETIERVFRWHLFSWVLTNLVAISYSDLALDIDKIYDDTDYRTAVIDALTSSTGVTPDFSDLSKFTRYCEFESFDVTAVCHKVVSTITDALGDGRLEAALSTLGTEPPITPTAVAVELLLSKIRASLASMAQNRRHFIGIGEWKAIAKKNRKIWFNPSIRLLARSVYPLAAPIIMKARISRSLRERGQLTRISRQMSQV